MNPSTSPQLLQQLAQLRDIRLPVETSWWPPAPGWWSVLGGVTILFCAAVILRALQRRSLKYAALRELDRLFSQDNAASSTSELATQVSILLRRVVLRSDQGRHLAQAHSEAWASFLSASPHGMPASIARTIAAAPYAQPTGTGGLLQLNNPTSAELLDATKSWIRRHA